ncbi:helix-turn-helix domain-containing protein [Streptomyces violascens]|uniref:AraC-like ligand-binding domain-containing protein n=1 Tax=Streptomyces violascens TaxID=67381 RepID=UPI00378D7C4F
MVEVTVFRTDGLPEPERFDAWCAMVDRSLVMTRLATDTSRPFHGVAHQVSFGGVRVSVLEYSGIRSRRSSALVRACDPELLQLGVTRSGRQSLAQGRGASSTSGAELLLSDTSQPYDAEVAADGEHARSLFVQVPRTSLTVPRAKVSALIARPLPAAEGLGGLLVQMLARAEADAAGYRPQDTHRLGTVAAQLIDAFLAHHLGLDDPPESRPQALLTAIHAFIERHLADPALAPVPITAAHHISVRYLHRLFASEGTTVGATVRGHRLERCRLDLTDPRFLAQPVRAIGARWGYANPADFSRAFRAAYGMPPGEYRRREFPLSVR